LAPPSLRGDRQSGPQLNADRGGAGGGGGGVEGGGGGDGGGGGGGGGRGGGGGGGDAKDKAKLSHPHTLRNYLIMITFSSHVE